MFEANKEVINSLTPLEKEAAEWCYQAFRNWMEQNETKREKNKNSITIAHLVFIEAFNFKPGELDAFKALKDKGIIFLLKPVEEKGGDFHEIGIDDAIVAVHKLLEKEGTGTN